ncbi:glycosyltransferase family 4 protein [Desulfovibrio aminophilus]|nr:glycosyltransferase family 4 protein [Desulfovibrio aminophilus]
MTRSLCLFNSNRAWGGGEQWFHTHALLLARRGWRVCAVTNEPSDLGGRLAEEPGIQLLRLPLGNLSFLNPTALRRLAGFFRDNAVDTVILALPSDVKAGGLAAKLAGVRRIIFRRGIALPTRNTFLNRLYFQHVLTGLLCNSEHTRRMVLAENPELMPLERTAVIHNGLDLPAFDALSAEPLVSRTPGRVVIGCAGRLTEQKGHVYLLEAAALLRRRGLDLSVLLAGTGELERDLRARTTALGLDQHVRFLGFVKEMKRFYASIDILALPSLWEGFGYVLTEAMSMGLPVAAFDTSNIPEVVVHGETGLLSPARDAEALAGSLEALAHDPDLRHRLGGAGRRRVEERFTLERTIQDLERLLLS